MYKIIGADGHEYGPVSTEQLQQWVREGRANGQTKVQVEGEIDWKTVESIAEFRDFLMAPGLSPVGTGTTGASAGAGTLDIGSCVSRSWALVKSNFGLTVGTTFLVFLILGSVGIVLRIGLNLASGLSLMDFGKTRGFQAFRMQLPGIVVSSLWYWIMTGPMMGGLYNFYLKLIRGQPAGVGDTFSGFGPQFIQLVLGSFITSFLVTIGMLFCLIPGIYFAVCWKFTLPTIIDKRLGFWEGMGASRRAVTGRWWLVFALALVTGLIGAAGVIACCIGVLVTSPIAIGAIAYAYEDLIGVQLPASA
jgi:hypothetical protein